MPSFAVIDTTEGGWRRIQAYNKDGVLFFVAVGWLGEIDAAAVTASMQALLDSRYGPNWYRGKNDPTTNYASTSTSHQSHAQMRADATPETSDLLLYKVFLTRITNSQREKTNHTSYCRLWSDPLVCTLNILR